MRYIEGPADASFTAFLAGLTPATAVADLASSFTDVEKRRLAYLVTKSISDRWADRQQRPKNQFKEKK